MAYKVFFHGRIGTDAETVVKDNNNSYITCRVAIDEFSNKEKITRWVNLTLDGDRFKNLGQYLKKGKFIFVTGTERVTSYLTKNGEPSIDTRVWVDSIEFIQTGTSERKSEFDNNKLEMIMEKITKLENKVDTQTNTEIESDEIKIENDNIHIENDNDLPF